MHDKPRKRTATHSTAAPPLRSTQSRNRNATGRLRWLQRIPYCCSSLEKSKDTFLDSRATVSELSVERDGGATSTHRPENISSFRFSPTLWRLISYSKPRHLLPTSLICGFHGAQNHTTIFRIAIISLRQSHSREYGSEKSERNGSLGSAECSRSCSSFRCCRFFGYCTTDARSDAGSLDLSFCLFLAVFRSLLECGESWLS